MSEMLQFLGGETPAEREVVTEPATAAPEPPRADEGAPHAPPSPPRGDMGQVPISALLDERERRQAERAQRETLERQLQQVLAAQAPGPDPTPTEVLGAAVYQQNLRSSRRFAEREYGKEVVAQVHAWGARRCDEDPHFNEQIRNSDDPYEAVYQAYNRERVLATVKPTDLAAFKAWQTAQTLASRANPAAPRAPRSLATASGAGSAGGMAIDLGAGAAFRNAIPR